MILLGMAFLIGFALPFISGRFGKILPADPGLVILRLFHHPHFPKTDDFARIRQLKRKWTRLIGFAVMWGCALTIAFDLSYEWLSSDMAPWACVYVTIICFAMVVDSQYHLLPDFFTIPLMMLGFWMIHSVPNMSAWDGLIGGIFGYTLSTVAVLFMGFFRKAELGFGDVKMMTALGVWLGMYGLNYTLLLSFFFFLIQSAIYARRSGPYGPALGLSAIITFFLIYIP